MLTDISFPYRSSMAIYPNNPDFYIKRVQDLRKGDGANVSLISMGSHTGTHIDAPAHFIIGGKTIDELPLEAMNGRAKVFDVRGNQEITTEILSRYEIEAGDIVIFKTDNSETFRGDMVLTDYVTLDYEAAADLVAKKVKMVGIDYMTIERPRAKRISGKSGHSVLLSGDGLSAETLELSKVEEGSYQLHCYPLNIVGADGVPARMAVSEAY